MTVKDFFEGGKILIFSIAMGADYSFYVKTIETHARSFFKVIIFSIGSVIATKPNNYGKSIVTYTCENSTRMVKAAAINSN